MVTLFFTWVMSSAATFLCLRARSRNANGVEALSPGLARALRAYPGARPTENGPTLNGLQPSVMRRQFATTPSGLRETRRTVSQGSLADSATAGLTDGTPLAFSAADALLPGGDVGDAFGEFAGRPQRSPHPTHASSRRRRRVSPPSRRWPAPRRDSVNPARFRGPF
jgi:hypothetical protein